MSVNLKKPITWNGQEITELDLKLDALTAGDLVKAERVFFSRNPGYASVPEFSSDYNLCVMAKALNVPVEDVEALPAKVAIRLGREVAAFFEE